MTTRVRAILRWLRPYWLVLLLGLLSVLAAGGFTLLTPLFVKQGVAALPAFDAQAWSRLALALAGRALFGFLGTYLLGWVAARAVTDLRQQLFSTFLHAPIPFHDHNWSANLVSTLTSDAPFIEASLGRLLPALAQHLPTATIAFLLLFAENWQLTLWLSIAGLPLVAFTLLAGRSLRRIAREGQASLGQLAIAAQETFLGLRLVKALTREDFFLRRFEHLGNQHFDLKRQRVLWQALLEGMLPFSAAILVVGASWLVQRQLAAGETSLSGFAAFAAYLTVFALSLSILVQAYATLENAVGAAQRVLALRGVAVEEEKLSEGQRLEQARGAITFDSVTFQYAEGRGGVRHLSLQIGPGEVIAIVGPNGAGKSTLIHLLLRFYRPQRGQICLDGLSADEIELRSWRRQFAVVTRDPVIFNLTVAENVALGRPTASVRDIEAAARAVGLHDWIIGLPDGYASLVGEYGVRLSAGQRQRLALARVFLQDPAVIIFDEATTSLDREREEAFAEALHAWAGSRTIILISHHPQRFWPVARILHMEAGTLVQADGGDDLSLAGWPTHPIKPTRAD